jgi:hypothetical protein
MPLSCSLAWPLLSKFCFSFFLFSIGTGDTATALTDRASNENLLEKYFVTKGKEGREGAANKRFADRVKKSRSRELGIHFENGIGIHHVGLIVAVDLLMEKLVVTDYFSLYLRPGCFGEIVS